MRLKDSLPDIAYGKSRHQHRNKKKEHPGDLVPDSIFFQKDGERQPEDILEESLAYSKNKSGPPVS